MTCTCVSIHLQLMWTCLHKIQILYEINCCLRISEYMLKQWHLLNSSNTANWCINRKGNTFVFHIFSWSIYSPTSPHPQKTVIIKKWQHISTTYISFHIICHSLSTVVISCINGNSCADIFPDKPKDLQNNNKICSELKTFSLKNNYYLISNSKYKLVNNKDIE